MTNSDNILLLSIQHRAIPDSAESSFIFSIDQNFLGGPLIYGQRGINSLYMRNGKQGGKCCSTLRLNALYYRIFICDCNFWMIYLDLFTLSRNPGPALINQSITPQPQLSDSLEKFKHLVPLRTFGFPPNWAGSRHTVYCGQPTSPQSRGYGREAESTIHLGFLIAW